MIKVCIIFPALFNKGGCETLMKYVIRSLYKEIKFYILTSFEHRNSEYQEFLNYTEEIVNVRPDNQQKLLDEFKRINPHVVFTGFFHFATAPCALLNIPLVEFCVGAKVMPKLQANPLHNYMTVESEGAKKQILKHRNYPEKRIKVIRNTVFYDGEIASEKDIRTLFDVPDGFSVVSLNARAVHGKGWPVIAEAMRIMADEKVIFIGFSRMEKARTSAWDKILFYNKTLKNFRVLNGADIEKSYVMGVTACSDIVCMPTTHREEGIPNCIVEAIYFGKPVVACRNGYIDEIVFDGENGMFVRPGAGDVAEAIKYLMSNDELRKNYSLRSKEIYNELYDREFFKNSYRQVFLDAAGEGYFYGNRKKGFFEKFEKIFTRFF